MASLPFQYDAVAFFFSDPSYKTICHDTSSKQAQDRNHCRRIWNFSAFRHEHSSPFSNLADITVHALHDRSTFFFLLTFSCNVVSRIYHSIFFYFCLLFCIVDLSYLSKLALHRLQQPLHRSQHPSSYLRWQISGKIYHRLFSCSLIIRYILITIVPGTGLTFAS